MRTAALTHALPREHGMPGLLGPPKQAARAIFEASGDVRRTPARLLGLFERFDRACARARQRDLERYLAGSKDIFELEHRIRNLERTRYF